MREPDGDLEAFLEHLYALELRPAQLRRDPYGESWLGAEWRDKVRDDPRYMAQLRLYVEEELELYDSVRGQADAFFTARVIEATSPEQVAGVGLAPRYRSWVLACAYAMATIAAVMIVGPWLRGSDAGATAMIHEAVSHGLGGAIDDAQVPKVAGGFGVLAGVAAAAALALVAIRWLWARSRA